MGFIVTFSHMNISYFDHPSLLSLVRPSLFLFPNGPSFLFFPPSSGGLAFELRTLYTLGKCSPI
jgi:hypothetical protein